MKAKDKLNKRTKKKIEKLKLSQLRKKSIVSKASLRLTKSMEFIYMYISVANNNPLGVALRVRRNCSNRIENDQIFKRN